MESKRQRRYLGGLEDNGAYAWTPYDAGSLKRALEFPLPKRKPDAGRRGWC